MTKYPQVSETFKIPKIMRPKNETNFQYLSFYTIQVVETHFQWSFELPIKKSEAYYIIADWN